MKDLKQEFQKETNLSFEDIPINGVHIEYINWLEKRNKQLSISGVVKSFYCHQQSPMKHNRCVNQCENCASKQ